MTEPHLYAVVVTYGREDQVLETLDAVAGQTRPPDSFLLVDNGRSRALEERVRRRQGVEYLRAPCNLGPAGGFALGCRQILPGATDDDLVVLVDDDDPPTRSDAIERLLVTRAGLEGRRVGCIGMTGARFDRRRGLMVRVPDDRMVGIVDVDVVPGGQLPVYSVAALRDIGSYDPDLFFGFEELDLGLRLGDGGWRVVVPGEMAMELRVEHGRVGLGVRATGGPLPAWRRYYSSRNVVLVTRRAGGRRAAARAAVTAGPAAAARALVVHRRPTTALMALRGAAAGLLGRHGRQVRPPRPVGAALEVLFVINSLAPGGTETSSVVLAARLAEMGIRTTFVLLKRVEHDLVDRARAEGSEVLLLKGATILERLCELRSLIRSRRPDIVHTALFDADQMGRVAAAGTGVPVVSSFVSTPYDPARLLDSRVVPWRLRVVRLIDSVTGRLFVRRFHAVSNGVRDANAAALRLPRSRVSVAVRGRTSPEPCHETSRREVRAALGATDDEIVLLNVGRQEHAKGQAGLIEALALVRRQRPDVRLWIAGREGNATTAVDAALTATGTDGAVELLGHRTDVTDLMCAADLLVISSLVEGTAGVALEAMSVGLPIVSTDLVGMTGILEDGVNAVLAPEPTPSALADAIDRALSDDELSTRIAATGHEDFERRFTLDASALGMAELYRDVAATS